MRRGERGMALFMTLAILVVISVLATTSVVTLKSLVRESTYQKRLLQAQALAESGTQNAMLQLVSSATWRTGFNQKPLAGGWYTVTLSTHARPWITSTGYAPKLALMGRPSRTVKFKAGTQPILQMPYAIQALRIITLAGSSKIDSYNSEVDPDPAVFGSSATLWTNQSVSFSTTGVRVAGSLNYFSGTAPSTWTVTGAIVKSTFTKTAPYTDGTAYKTDNDNLTGFSPQAYYNAGTKNVDIPSGATATIKTGVYYFNKLTVAGTLNLVLTNGPVSIYFDANVDVTGAIVNPSKIPANLLMYAQTVNTVKINSPAKLYIVIEARTADFTIDSEIYGALVTEDIDFSPTGKLHYDLSLLRPRVNAVRVVPGTWVSSFSKS